LTEKKVLFTAQIEIINEKLYFLGFEISVIDTADDVKTPVHRVISRVELLEKFPKHPQFFKLLLLKKI